MIKINLLPPELQTRKGRPSAGAVAPAAGTAPPGAVAALTAVVGAVFLVAWLVVGYGMVYGPVTAARTEADRIRARHDKMEKDYTAQKAQYAKEYRQWTLMRDQIEIMGELMPDKRLLWSEKLNMLSNLVPEGVFLTGVEVKEKIDMVETEQSIVARKEYKKQQDEANALPMEKDKNRKLRELGDEPPAIQKPLITQTMILKAVTLLKEDENADRLEKVIEFQKRMQEYEMVNAKGEQRRFKDFFRLTADDKKDLVVDTGLMEVQELDGVPVWSFEFTLTTESQGGRKSGSGDPGVAPPAGDRAKPARKPAAKPASKPAAPAAE